MVPLENTLLIMEIMVTLTWIMEIRMIRHNDKCDAKKKKKLL